MPCNWKYHNYWKEELTPVEEFLVAGFRGDFSDFTYAANEVYQCCHKALVSFIDSPDFQTFRGSENICVGLFQGDQSYQDIKANLVQEGSFVEWKVQKIRIAGRYSRTVIFPDRTDTFSHSCVAVTWHEIGGKRGVE